MLTIKQALISVYDKTGILEFARELEDLGYRIISTGSTCAVLRQGGIKELLYIEDVTGSPEMLDGRVKTLHPRIHGGILAARDNPDHLAQLEKLNIGPIDIVVNNLYPFEETISKEGVTPAEAIENIDVGGPSMIRAAAKNHNFVTVITEPGDYSAVLAEIKESGDVRAETRLRLAAKAFAMTARYDGLIGKYLGDLTNEGSFPPLLNLNLKQAAVFSYGENPHQKAAFYKDPFETTGAIGGYKQIHGGPLSFNNINDANGAVELVREFKEPAAVASKHANPCGVGTGETISEAWSKALNADPISVYGGIVAFNREVDEYAAEQMRGILIDIIIAPSYAPKALALLQKKKGTRLLELPHIAAPRKAPGLDFKRVAGGIIVQETDNVLFPGNTDITEQKIVTARPPAKDEYADLLFAWKIVKHVKSNAIVIAKNGQSIGIGCGQVNRIWPTKQAIEHAMSALGADSLKGAAMASDAFFPFDDCVTAAAAAGIRAIIQPGGSIRDADSVAVCDKHDMAMIYTGMRHFKH